jgi:hypothetical protein
VPATPWRVTKARKLQRPTVRAGAPPKSDNGGYATGGTNSTAKIAARGGFEVLGEESKNVTNPVILLEKCCRTGNRIGPRDKALNQSLQSLIQNLQKLNQKVK